MPGPALSLDMLDAAKERRAAAVAAGLATPPAPPQMK